MVHELFHIDKNREYNVPGQTAHITDRQVRIAGPGHYHYIKNAYGPLYTKVLARYSKGDVGSYVATNADDLAFYFLGKWIQERYGFYPHQPTATEVPAGIQKRAKRDDPPTDESYDTPDVWDPIRVADGQVSLGDLNDLVIALGAESREDAQILYDDDPDACLDLVAEGENGENALCADGGEVVELEATEDPLGAGPMEGLPADPVPAGPDAGVVTTGNDEAVPTEDPLGAGPVENNGPDAEVVPTQDVEAIPTADLVDALTAGLAEPLPAGPTAGAEVPDPVAEVVPDEGEAVVPTEGEEVIPAEGAEVIPNKGAHSSIPSNSTAHQ
ncbi:hypothetical protein ACHAPT_013141 [Fusarium lateritium]